jgi:sortase A
MPDRRTVDELSIEELEEILAIRKREARQVRLERLRGEGRVLDVSEIDEPIKPEPPAREALPPTPSYYRTNEVPDESAGRRRFSLRPSAARVKTWRDRFLLLVEVGALIGLVVVIVGLEQSRIETNQSAVGSVDIPTPQPTPLINAVVLPSGHRPPTAPGGPAFNLDEIPVHLRAYVQSAPPLPIPLIRIDAIGVNATIVEGDDWEQLKKGVGHHLGTANPGERGNLVLSAHNDIFGEIFRNLYKLEPGDDVVVYAGQQQYHYKVTDTRYIAPSQVEVMLPTSDPTLTLISCWPYLVDTQRIAVFAQLVQ